MQHKIILEPIKPEDWLFGADNGLKKFRAKTSWIDYLPSNEFQRFEHFDAMDCVTRSALNCLEIEFNYKIANKIFSPSNIKWLKDKGYIDSDGLVNFNDSFNAALSGTTEYGNSLARVTHSIRYDGLIPERLYQSGAGLTRSQYLATPPQHLIDLGQEFLKLFKINFEVVQAKDFITALDFGPVQVVVNAWKIRSGVYYNTTQSWNHGVCLFDFDSYFQIFDSYFPFIKSLEPEYLFYSHGYQFTTTEVEPLLNQIINMLKEFFRAKDGGIFVSKANTDTKQKINFNDPVEALKLLTTFITREFGIATKPDEEIAKLKDTKYV